MARVVLDLAARRRRAPDRGGLPARRGEAPARGRQPRGQPRGPSRRARWSSVFLPERLELVKGAPAARRAHLDQVVAALWPGRAETRAALLARARAAERARGADPRAGRRARRARRLGRRARRATGSRLMADRDEAVEGLRPLFAELAERLGLHGRRRAALPAALGGGRRGGARRRAGGAARGRPRRAASRPTARTATSSSCCSTAPRSGHTARRASSAPPSWRSCSRSAALLAERRARPPLMLLDDVMSELDAERRELLAGLLRSGRPGGDHDDRARARARHGAGRRRPGPRGERDGRRDRLGRWRREDAVARASGLPHECALARA